MIVRTLAILAPSLLSVAPLAGQHPDGAPLRVAGVFAHHMVLQQGRKAPVWGTAGPGSEITVSIAGKGVTGVAGADGRWHVALPPLPAGGPHELIVTCSSEDNRRVLLSSATFRDVLVGEVWVCSGQSNMEWPVSESMNAKQEIAAAKHPRIRLFKINKTVRGSTLAEARGGWRRKDWLWVECTPESVGEFSAVGYYFGRALQRARRVPIGLVQSAWGGTPAEAWISASAMGSNADFKPILDRWAGVEHAHARWREAAVRAKRDGKKPPPQPMRPDHPHRASGLFNGMIAPLIPYAIRGVIWYQGESNAGRAEQYAELFPAMIRDWRARWGRGKFPFLFVQLANFKVRGNPLSWAELREAQRRTLALADTGMAVTIDIGDAGDIHPRNKQEVGRRLALLARAKVHGESVACDGPVFRGLKVEGRALRLTFGGKLAVAGGDRLNGFEIAGADGAFVAAKARIEGTSVIVESGVEKPVAARYGWSDNPQCNLVDDHGLPASPFRTDTGWKWVTAGKR